ncbi:MAG: hypothetical protein ABH983_02415 [Candidatus Micrarchaeota archaeon]
MRQKTRSIAQATRSSTKEPLAEGLKFVVPTDSRGRRLWSKITDGQIVEHAKKFMKDNGISARGELNNADSGLYNILRTRGLLGQIQFENKRISWQGVDNAELIKLARTMMEERGITSRSEFRKEDRNLFYILEKRGLFYILEKRGLLDEVGFKEKRRKGRPWSDMSDEEIIEYARKVMKENGIRGKKELQKSDSGLYNTLRARGLIDEIEFERKRRKKRSWKIMSDKEVVEFAKRFIEEDRITRKKGLEKTYRVLYKVLLKRGLIDEVGFEAKRKMNRSWDDMINAEIIETARNLIKEKGIILRGELKAADSGLYEVLRRRSILNQAFAHIDKQKDDQARDAVIDALEAFAANDNAISEDDVA